MIYRQLPNAGFSTIIILVSLLAAVSLAAAYTPEQQATVDGVRLSFQLGQAYDKAAQGQDVPAFNALVDQWNTWVVKNFGNDTTLLMAKMTAPAQFAEALYCCREQYNKQGHNS